MSGAAGDPAEAPVLDVVPLFEDAATLEAAGPILDAILTDPTYRRHLAAGATARR